MAALGRPGPTGKVTEQQAEILDGLLNRASARRFLRGRGPWMLRRAGPDVETNRRRRLRRMRKRVKSIQQRLRAQGEIA